MKEIKKLQRLLGVKEKTLCEQLISDCEFKKEGNCASKYLGEDWKLTFSEESVRLENKVGDEWFDEMYFRSDSKKRLLKVANETLGTMGLFVISLDEPKTGKSYPVEMLKSVIIDDITFKF